MVSVRITGVRVRGESWQTRFGEVMENQFFLGGRMSVRAANPSTHWRTLQLSGKPFEPRIDGGNLFGAPPVLMVP